MKSARFFKRNPGVLLVALFVAIVWLFDAVSQGDFPNETKKLLTLTVAFGSMGALWLLAPLLPVTASKRIDADDPGIQGGIGWAKAILIFALAIVFLIGLHTRALNLVLASGSLVAATLQNLLFDGKGRIREDAPGAVAAYVRRTAKSVVRVTIASAVPACLVVLATAQFSDAPFVALDCLPPSLLTLTWLLALLQHRKLEISSGA